MLRVIYQDCKIISNFLFYFYSEICVRNALPAANSSDNELAYLSDGFQFKSATKYGHFL